MAAPPFGALNCNGGLERVVPGQLAERPNNFADLRSIECLATQRKGISNSLRKFAGKRNFPKLERHRLTPGVLPAIG
jgi:hypothetical protein